MKINHSSEVLSGLKSSLNSSTLNDVKILVGKEKKVFYASSLLLATRSPISKAMFFYFWFKRTTNERINFT